MRLVLLASVMFSAVLRTTAEGVPQPLNLLDSYLPAGMQIIAHVTDLMKYEISPPPVTTTTVRPTKPHAPAVYAPERPPGPGAYFSKGTTQDEYVHILQTSEGQGYFDKYKMFAEGRSLGGWEPVNGTEFAEADRWVGRGFGEVLRLANAVEGDVEGAVGDEEVVGRFAVRFDDDVREGRQKRVPPTKAYVSLLSLYDLLNKEAKKLMLNKYEGYTEGVLKELEESSKGESSSQLKTVLSLVVQKRNIRQENVVKKIQTIVTDLEQENSYINNALRGIPPLQFIS